MLFSATFKKRVEKLARDVLTDPIRVVQGDVGEANEDITQVIHLLNSQQSKFQWLLHRIVEFLSAGTLLIFVTKKVLVLVFALVEGGSKFPEIFKFVG